MEFGRHLGKGIWAFADKALPAVYGVGFIFLVARILPSDQYGLFAIVQSLFNVFSATISTVALQPLVKYISEHDDASSYTMMSLLIQISMVLVFSVLITNFSETLAMLLDDSHFEQLSELLWWIPLMLSASILRGFAISVLQSSYEMNKIFLLDSILFFGMLVGYGFLFWQGTLDTATDIIFVNIFVHMISSLIALKIIFRRISWKFAFFKKEFLEILRFGRYMFGGSVSYTLFSQFDIFFVGYFSGAIGVASYFNAKIFVRIFDIVGQVLQMFLIPFSSRASAKKEYLKMGVVAEKVLCFSTIALLPVSASMLLAPSFMLSVLYAGRYDDAYEIVRVLGLLILVYPLNAVFSNYLIGMGKAREGFQIGVAITIVSLPLYYLLGMTLGPVGVALAFVGSLAISSVLLTSHFVKYSPIRISAISSLLRVVDVVEYLRMKSLKRYWSR